MGANRILALVILAALAMPPAALAQTAPKKPRKARVAAETPAQRALREAEAALDKQDYSAAERLLLPVTATDPKEFRAWFHLGVVYGATDRKPQAIEAYRKALAAQPDLFEANLNLGILLAQAGSPEAEKHLRAATQLKPSADVDEGKARAWLSLGAVLSEKNPAEALVAYQELARLRPKDADAHLGSAMALERLERYPEAAAEFTLAAGLDPASDEALAGLANVSMRQANWREAEAALRKIVQRSPRNAAAHLQLGRVLRAQNRSDEARSSFLAAVEIAPEDADVLKELAALEVAAGDYSQAVSRYRILAQKEPGDALLRHAFGNALMNQRDFPAAQQELLTAVKLKPDLAEAYGDLAVAANGNQDYQLALQALDARARYLPENPGTLFLRATAYDHLKAFPQAVEFYKQFLTAAAGKFPDQEWQARHRLIAIDPKSRKN